MKFFYALLIMVPVAVVLELIHAQPTFVFFASALSLVPLAAVLGKATEELAVHTGPRIGGLLNATLGNAAELIITIVALNAGLLDLVKASITGSVLGNILVVLGFSLLVGGLKNGMQKFNQHDAGVVGTMLFLAVISIAVPTAFAQNTSEQAVSRIDIQSLSTGISVVMIVLYVAYLVYTFMSAGPQTLSEEEHPEAAWSLPISIGVLALTTGATVWMSEILVGAVEPLTESLGWSEVFLGVMIIPLVGNVAEHVVAVQQAYKNHMDLSVAISLGSSLQVALFVAPMLVFISLLMGHPMNLAFSVFEIVALVAAVAIGVIVSLDGRSNWLEGAQLVAVYCILGLAFFFLP